MAVVAGTPDPNQPKWLALLPQDVATKVRAMIAAQDRDVQAKLDQARRFVSEEFLAACETAEDVVELLRSTAESMVTDQQAKYIPPVYRIDHRFQKFQDDVGDSIKGPFRAVILYFQPTRGFFLEGRKLPLCSAMGNWLNGTTTENAREDWEKHPMFTGVPLDWKTKNCSECVFNNFGTDPKTLAGKACKEKYRLFLMPVGPEDQLTGDGVMMNVPPTSLKGLDEHMSRCQRWVNPATGRKDPKTTLMVVTEFNLEKAVGQSQEYAKILFKVHRALTPSEFKAVNAIRQQLVKVAEHLGVEVGETYDQAAPEGEGAAKPAGPEEYDEKLGF